MTIITGIKYGNEIWIGGDSAGTDEFGDLSIRNDTKVFKKGNMLIGFAGSFRMGQLLRYALELPEHKSDVETMAYLVIDFCDAVRHCLSSRGQLLEKEGEAEGMFGEFLIAYRNELYYIGDDLQVGINRDGYAACGSGALYALGALRHMFIHDSEWKPWDMVYNALNISCHHHAECRGPFNILGIDKDGNTIENDPMGRILQLMSQNQE
jgi:ATP-dependent protease HslVU (ClpYQ), peptidase subunit